MEFKKSFLGCKVYIGLMRNFFIVNEANKELFIQTGHFEVFEHESINKEKPIKLVTGNSARTGKRGNGKVLSVPVQE